MFVRSRLLRATVLLGVLAAAREARAHGEPPEALSIVATDADGVSAVRLNEGLALRTPEGFRFVCPALWGSDEAAPACSAPDGPVIIGAGSGLFVADARGAVARHPDPAASGFITTLGASSQALFALRVQGGLHQVLRVGPERVEVVWSSELRWDDMAVGKDLIHLVRLEANRVHAVHLSTDTGQAFEDQAELPMPCSAVLARVAGQVPYAIAIGAALDAQLGRIEGGQWVALETARVLAGPIETEERQLIALDGDLARFDDERVEPLVEPAVEPTGEPVGAPAFITCLRTHQGLAYACSNRGLRTVGAEGLGDSLFDLEQLVAPDLESVPSDQRDACALQWQRYELDLRAVGIATSERPDAGSQTDAGRAPDAGADAHAADARPSGCEAGGDDPAPGNAGWIMLALALWARSGRRSPRGCNSCS